MVEAANEDHAEILYHNLEKKLDLVITDAPLPRVRAWGGHLPGMSAILTIGDSVGASDRDTDVRGVSCLHIPFTAEEIAFKVQSAIAISKHGHSEDGCLGDD